MSRSRIGRDGASNAAPSLFDICGQVMPQGGRLNTAQTNAAFQIFLRGQRRQSIAPRLAERKKITLIGKAKISRFAAGDAAPFAHLSRGHAKNAAPQNPSVITATGTRSTTNPKTSNFYAAHVT
jgi:hypothetical protein